MSIEGAEGGRYYTPGAAYIVRSWYIDQVLGIFQEKLDQVYCA